MAQETEKDGGLEVDGAQGQVPVVVLDEGQHVLPDEGKGDTIADRVDEVRLDVELVDHVGGFLVRTNTKIYFRGKKVRKCKTIFT